MQVVVERCAFLDVHRDTVMACARTPDGAGGRHEEVAEFRTTTSQLLVLSDWLVERGVTRVGMEATGVYWKPVHWILEEAIEAVWVINARHMRNVPGRKTDVADACWGAQLIEHGLVRPSFIPPRPTREQRDLTRYRTSVPTIQRFTTPAEEAEFVAAQVQEWLEDNVALGAIGITARTRRDLRAVQSALDEADIRWSEIGSDAKQPGVRTATMHSCKGLEFARLAVVAANADNLPLPVATTPAADDEAQHALDVLRERCLLYVACTRARDELVVTSSGTPSTLLPR